MSNPDQFAAAAKRPRRVMVAMVLGTALSALGPAAETASAKTVNDLSRYCTACWRNARLPADCWGDCTQEVLTRLLERVPAQQWEQTLRNEGDERREFLRAIDVVKKRVQRARKWLAYPDQVADRRNDGNSPRAELREELQQAAEKLLSERQRHILHRSLDGYSVQEIADELGVGPPRVSDDKYKAIRKLRAHLHEVT